MRPNNPILINGEDATVDQVSDWIDSAFIFTGSVQVYFSANDAAGTFVLQASDEPYESLPGGESPQHPIDIPNTSTSVASGAAKLISVAQMNYRWIRAKWTPSGGSPGTINCNGFFLAF